MKLDKEESRKRGYSVFKSDEEKSDKLVKPAASEEVSNAIKAEKIEKRQKKSYSETFRDED